MALITKYIRLLGQPFLRHAAFCLFMALLLWITYDRVHVPMAQPAFYALQFALDLYLVCCLFCLLPRRWAFGAKCFFYVVAYLLCVVEAFLYARFYIIYSPTMLNLAFETNAGEASEFLSVCFKSPKVWPILLTYGGVAVGNVAVECYGRRLWLHLCRHFRWIGQGVRSVFGVLTAVLLLWGVVPWCQEKGKMLAFFSLEKSELTERVSTDVFYSPFYRIVYSLKFIDITRRETHRLIAEMKEVSVDTCSFLSPNIVIVIGESYNKHHAQIYGYPMPTTPRMAAMAQRGELIVFTDAVTPWNVTSNAFKNFLSTHSTDQQGSWTDGVLFPAIMRKAGYKTAFITNQFYKSARQNKADFNGSFFLNDAQADSLCFDYRNTKHYKYDGGFLGELNGFETGAHNLILLHLIGQHLEYALRFPESEVYFSPKDYERKDLDSDALQVVADYDNATRYNDKVFARICDRYRQENVVIIYFADHGDEVYDDGIGMYGRNHSADLTPQILRGEFEVPMMMWFSPSYRAAHPDIVKSAFAAKDKPFGIDDLPHLVLGLSGIRCKYYNASRDLLHASYTGRRPRPIKDLVDYNRVMHKP